MRILLAAQFFPPDIGGEERHVYNLANMLASRGHSVSVATQHVQGLPDVELLPSGANVRRFKTMAMQIPGVYATERQHHFPFPDPIGVRNLARILRVERPDVVHAHNWIVNSFLPLHRRPTGRANFGLVLTLHDYSNTCATKRMMSAARPCSGPQPVKCLRCASQHYGFVVGPVTAAATAVMRPWKEHGVDYTVSVSRAVAHANGILDGPRASVIPNFVPDAAMQDASGAESEDQLSVPRADYLLFVGDLSREKGVSTLLRAYESLPAKRPRLVLVGRRTPDTPINLPAGAEIHFGWPHEDVMRAFRGCLAAVLPSVWPDPCPTTVLEAMASGRPVITTSIGGMVDMVVDGHSGLLVPPGDARSLTEALNTLLSDGSLRSRLGSNGKERVRMFTASVVVQQLEAVYERVAPRPAWPSASDSAAGPLTDVSCSSPEVR